MRIWALCAAIGLVVGFAARALATEPAYDRFQVFPRGGLHGGDALVVPMGQLQGLRDIQGGRDTGRRQDLNLDIGAGSATARGDLVLNYDVGRRVLIFDGHRRLVAKFSGKGIVFYRRPVVRTR